MSSGHSAVKIVDSVCLSRPRAYMLNSLYTPLAL